jgi:integrase
MAKTKIDLDAGREKLKYRSAPYSEPLCKGTALLLYKGKLRDRWGARTSFGDRVIGTTEEMTYEQARTAVKDIAKAEAQRGVKVDNPREAPDAITYGVVWQRYVDACAAEGKTPAAMRTISGYASALAPVLAIKVATTSADVLQAALNAQIGTSTEGARKRTAASMAKATSAFKTACRKAKIGGHWRDLDAAKKASPQRREIVALMDDDLRAFTDAAYNHSHDLGVFVQALALTGARPNELRMADVGDLRPDGLVIRFDKNIAKRRKSGLPPRVVHLPPSARAFFEGLVRARASDEPLLGHRMQDIDTRYPVAAIAKQIGVPGATLYGLRHGFITHSIYAGVPEASIAASCGTSPEMIRKTYYHVVAERERVVWANVDPYGSGHLRVAGGSA